MEPSSGGCKTGCSFLLSSRFAVLFFIVCLSFVASLLLLLFLLWLPFSCCFFFFFFFFFLSFVTLKKYHSSHPQTKQTSIRFVAQKQTPTFATRFFPNKIFHAVKTNTKRPQDLRTSKVWSRHPKLHSQTGSKGKIDTLDPNPSSQLCPGNTCFVVGRVSGAF